MSRRPRIAIGGIAHETNTFATTPTTLDDVRQRTLLSGEALLANARGTDGALGGIVDAANRRADIFPTLFASATPGGPMERSSWETLRYGLVSRLTAHVRRYTGIDAVILVLHGALVVDSVQDAEGALLREVRDLIGDRPLVIVVDFHANLSRAMIETTDLIIPYRTYPHLDTRACGIEALEACLAILEYRIHPVTAWRPLPIRSPLPAQITDGNGVFARLTRKARAIESRPDVHLAALVPGFPYSESLETCASVLVTTEKDPTLANHLADELAMEWWQVREDLQIAGVPLQNIAGILTDTSAGKGPVVLADIADNPGAGAPGDSTWLIQHLFDTGQRDVGVATIVDPVSVAAYHMAGVGETLRLPIGGTASPWSGQPIERDWTILHLGDGVFANHGPLGRKSITRLGRTATIVSEGIAVILCERRVQVLEPACFETCGIDPRAMNTLVVKSSVHYRAAFGPIARRMVEVETPGLCRSNMQQLFPETAPVTTDV